MWAAFVHELRRFYDMHSLHWWCLFLVFLVSLHNVYTFFFAWIYTFVSVLKILRLFGETEKWKTTQLWHNSNSRVIYGKLEDLTLPCTGFFSQHDKTTGEHMKPVSWQYSKWSCPLSLLNGKATFVFYVTGMYGIKSLIQFVYPSSLWPVGSLAGQFTWVHSLSNSIPGPLNPPSLDTIQTRMRLCTPLSHVAEQGPQDCHGVQ